MSEQPPILSLIDVTVRLGDDLAFVNVRLDVRAGESVGMVVPTGRTSLLMVAAGLREPDGGQVLLEGKPIESAYRDLVHEATTGFVFQGGGLLENTSIADNIALPLRYHTSMSESAIEERVRTALEDVDLLDEGGRLPFQLPRGKQRLAALARAVSVEPALVFVDDLHHGATEEIWTRFVRVMDQARQRWQTAFLSSLPVATGLPPGVDRLVRVSAISAG